MISNKSEIRWPPNSPNCNPIDFFFWHHSMGHVFKTKHLHGAAEEVHGGGFQQEYGRRHGENCLRLYHTEVSHGGDDPGRPVRTKYGKKQFQNVAVLETKEETVSSDCEQ